MELPGYVAGFEPILFVEKPSEMFDCPLCLNVLNEPRQCEKGHSFCKPCIELALNKKEECPICKTKLKVYMLSNSLMAQQCIGKMESYCPSTDQIEKSSESCQWTGPFHSRTAHMTNECGFLSLSCANLCGQIFLRKDLLAHNTICPNVELPCEFCGENNQRLYKRSKLFQHKLICENRLVTCDNGCGALIPFNSKSNHLKCCPLTVIRCPLKDLGIENHICVEYGAMNLSQIKEHLLGDSTIYETLTEIGKLHTNRIEKLESNFAELQAQYPSTQQKLNDVQSETAFYKEQSIAAITKIDTVTLENQIKISSLVCENESLKQKVAANDEKITELESKFNNFIKYHTTPKNDQRIDNSTATGTTEASKVASATEVISGNHVRSSYISDLLWGKNDKSNNGNDGNNKHWCESDSDFDSDVDNDNSGSCDSNGSDGRDSISNNKNNIMTVTNDNNNNINDNNNNSNVNYHNDNKSGQNSSVITQNKSKSKYSIKTLDKNYSNSNIIIDSTSNTNNNNNDKINSADGSVVYPTLQEIVKKEHTNKVINSSSSSVNAFDNDRFQVQNNPRSISDNTSKIEKNSDMNSKVTAAGTAVVSTVTANQQQTVVNKKNNNNALRKAFAKGGLFSGSDRNKPTNSVTLSINDNIPDMMSMLSSLPKDINTINFVSPEPLAKTYDVLTTSNALHISGSMYAGVNGHYGLFTNYTDIEGYVYFTYIHENGYEKSSNTISSSSRSSSSSSSSSSSRIINTNMVPSVCPTSGDSWGIFVGKELLYTYHSAPITKVKFPKNKAKWVIVENISGEILNEKLSVVVLHSPVTPFNVLK